MKKFTKILCLALVLAILSTVFASCAEKNEPKKIVDTGINNETDEDAPTFTEADFNEDTFTILSAVINVEDFGDNYIDNEERTGEPINDAVIDRNQAVEDKYNIDIVCRAESAGYASQAAKSGTVDFEIVYDWGIRLVPHATEGLFYDLLQVPYIDLEQDYWVPSSQYDLTIADKMLVFTCDVSMNRLGYASFLIFNKRILDDNGIEYPYSYVNKNEWTVDNLYDMVIKCSNDVDGDQLWTVEDVYGYGDSGMLGTAINGSGLNTQFTLKNDDGSYRLNVYTDKLVTIFNEYDDRAAVAPAGTFCDLGWQDFIEGRDISMYDSKFQAGRVFNFGEGHTAITGTSMSYLVEFQNMEDQYGVVPMPKYEASQSEYYHYIDNCAPMFSIIKQADMEKVGIIMEYLSYESEQRLLPAYYEQTIKTKQMSDLEGRDEGMLDIIRDSIHYNWTSLYYQSIKNSEGYGWDPCGTMLGEMLAAGNFSSVNKKYSAAAQKSLDDIYELILDMDVNK